MSEPTKLSSLDELSKAIDYALDGTKVGFELSDRLRYLDEQIITNKKRALIEYYRIYLTTLSDFKEIFQKEIAQLPEGVTRINWNSFISKLPTDFRKNNQDLYYIMSGYSDLSVEVHTINKDDLIWFKQTMESSNDQDDSEIWATLSKLILENFSSIQTQKDALKKDRRI